MGMMKEYVKNNGKDVSKRCLEFPISEGTKKPGYFFMIAIEDIPGIENVWILLRRTTCSYHMHNTA